MEKFRGFIASEKSGTSSIFNYRIGLATYGEQLKYGTTFTATAITSAADTQDLATVIPSVRLKTRQRVLPTQYRWRT